MKAKLQPKLSLEQYISFHENPHLSNLTANYLNQIIFMHGFAKLHRNLKKEVMVALSSIEPILMSPRRSTIEEAEKEVSSSAFLSLEQVREDLEALDWKECPVQTIQTLKSAEENLLAADDLRIICASSALDPCRFLPSPSTVESRGGGRPKFKKMKKTTAIAHGSDQLTGGGADAADLLPSWQSIGCL